MPRYKNLIGLVALSPLSAGHPSSYMASCHVLPSRVSVSLQSIHTVPFLFTFTPISPLSIPRPPPPPWTGETQKPQTTKTVMITMPLLASAAVEARALYSFPILIVSNESTHPACDQCRKTKSKCERPSGDATQCKSCALAGTREYSYPPTLLYYTQFPYIPACTFLGM